MNASNGLLDVIEIATPCHANWDDMQGDDRSRFCRDCNLHVYNLSNMTRQDAEALIRATEGRLCVRMFRRADGTVLTQDCPVGLAAIRRRAARLVAAVVALLAFLIASFAAIAGSPARTKNNTASRGPLGRLVDWLEPPPPFSALGGIAMGDIALPVAPRPAISSQAAPTAPGSTGE